MTYTEGLHLDVFLIFDVTVSYQRCAIWHFQIVISYRLQIYTTGEARANFSIFHPCIVRHMSSQVSYPPLALTVSYNFEFNI